MVLIENDKKESVRQADMRWRTRQPEVFKKVIGKWGEKHPNYKKDYMKEWHEKHPNYGKEWNEKHPNYKKDYMKKWKSSVKRINAGSILDIEGVDLAVLSESDKSIFREIDEAIRKESASKQDEW
jgi:hypothetical protein